MLQVVGKQLGKFFLNFLLGPVDVYLGDSLLVHESLDTAPEGLEHESMIETDKGAKTFWVMLGENPLYSHT